MLATLTLGRTRIFEQLLEGHLRVGLADQLAIFLNQCEAFLEQRLTKIVRHLLLEDAPLDRGKVHNRKLLLRHLVQMSLNLALGGLRVVIRVVTDGLHISATSIILLLDVAFRHN